MNQINVPTDTFPHVSSRTAGSMLVRTVTRLIRVACVLAVPFLIASDHADPIDPFNKERLEGGITDLFVFPVTENGKVAFPFTPTDMISLSDPNLDPRQELSAEKRAEIKGLVVILCVRRALTQRSSLQLEPYTYRIHMDQFTPVAFVDPNEKPKDYGTGAGGGYQASPVGQGGGMQGEQMSIQEARTRYGGSISHIEGINANITFELRLKNDTTLNGDPVITGLRNINDVCVYQGSPDELKAPNRIVVHTGVHDDPFIFPAFFRTNVVAMVLHIPIDAFVEGKRDWLVWATSHKDGRQVDHVGRSLRTQNPRFEILNTLPPSQHVDAIRKANANPSLKRDLGLRFMLQGVAAYRRWDFVPDVMIYTTRYEVGFPNGRTIADDVAVRLAQHGDTALLELSHQHMLGGWPRRTTNDMPFHKTTIEKPFEAEFPYLADPWPERPQPDPPMLRRRNQAKLGGLIAAVVVLLIAIGFALARWYYIKKLRRRYV
jgi:hypothetical protein